MNSSDLSKVGKKGEILPKKELRSVTGLKPGDQILLEAKKGELIIRKVYSVKELLAMPVITKDSADLIEEDIFQEEQRQMKMSLDEHENSSS
jgi:bifunctional DNA-binding transcriptional regulator/antitoxin component of YhaV-PrlF toxin-antitoxin module